VTETPGPDTTIRPSTASSARIPAGSPEESTSTGAGPGAVGEKATSPANNGCPRCLAFGHLGYPNDASTDLNPTTAYLYDGGWPSNNGEELLMNVETLCPVCDSLHPCQLKSAHSFPWWSSRCQRGRLAHSYFSKPDPLLSCVPHPCDGTGVPADRPHFLRLHAGARFSDPPDQATIILPTRF
jgi:hypothetical protein